MKVYTKPSFEVEEIEINSILDLSSAGTYDDGLDWNGKIH